MQSDRAAHADRPASRQYLLLPAVAAKECDARGHGLYLPVCADNLEVALVLETQVVVVHVLGGVVVLTPVDVVVDWVLDAAKAEPTVKDGAAVLFVALAKSWVLVELRQDLIEGRNRMVALQVLKFFLDRLTCQLIIFAFLEEVASVVRVDVGGQDAL